MSSSKSSNITHLIRFLPADWSQFRPFHITARSLEPSCARVPQSNITGAFLSIYLFWAQPCTQQLAPVSELSMCKINPNVDVTLRPRGPLTAVGLGENLGWRIRLDRNFFFFRGKGFFFIYRHVGVAARAPAVPTARTHWVFISSAADTDVSWLNEICALWTMNEFVSASSILSPRVIECFGH